MIAVLYPTKKALKDSVGKELRYSETSVHGNELMPGKAVTFVGPSAYNRKFYGSVTVDNNYHIVKVS